MNYLRAGAVFGEVFEAADGALLDVEGECVEASRVLTGSAPETYSTTPPRPSYRHPASKTSSDVEAKGIEDGSALQASGSTTPPPPYWHPVDAPLSFPVAA
jgi:hypothetical protein